MIEIAITHHKGGNKIDTVNETGKPQVSKSKKDKSISNESKKGVALDKSRPSQRNETEDTVKPLKKGLSPQPVYLIKVST